MLAKRFRKETGVRLPMTRTHEAYAYYFDKYSEWLEAELKEARELLEIVFKYGVIDLETYDITNSFNERLNNFLNKQIKKDNTKEDDRQRYL